MRMNTNSKIATKCKLEQCRRRGAGCKRVSGPRKTPGTTDTSILHYRQPSSPDSAIITPLMSHSEQHTFVAIRKVLIANRGEIACRIIKSCKELGLTSVAVYTPADRTSAHVSLADEAWLLPGPDQSAYIDEDAVISVARKSGSQAIIPGYGELRRSMFADDRLSVRERCVCRAGRVRGLDLGWTISGCHQTIRTQTYCPGARVELWRKL